MPCYQRENEGNLSLFEIYLQSLFIEFVFLGIADAWPHNSNYDLYHIENYDFAENHSTTK